MAQQIPRHGRLDSTLALLADPYRFISTRCRAHGTDVFETRLMLRRAVCAVGEDAARAFYTPNRFTRRGALPPTALLLLQDRGSAAVLDGAAHHHRKRMLMSLMTPDRIAALGDAFEAAWRAEMARWQERERVVLAEAVPEVLCRAVCAWAGVPLAEREVQQRTRELVAMYEGAGSVGPRNWKGQLLRVRNERWLRDLVEQVRAGTLPVPGESALAVVAAHRQPDGTLLPVRHAAVELLNVLRPTVAVERYVTFAALALHEHPECRARLAEAADDRYVEWFVQEVRRHYPFFPVVGGRALQAFEWRGRRFDEGTFMLLDLHGTNHDPRSWPEPERFRPERFASWAGSAFDLIPQGGGDHEVNHRCAGEWVTIDLMKRAARLLARDMRYEVPEQDLRLDMSHLPAVPRSRFVITRVRRAAPAA